MKAIVLGILFFAVNTFAASQPVQVQAKAEFLSNNKCPQFERVLGSWYTSNKDEALRNMEAECESWNGSLRPKSVLRTNTYNGYSLLMGICTLGSAARTNLKNRSQSVACPNFERVVSSWYAGAENRSKAEVNVSVECKKWNGILRQGSFTKVATNGEYTFAGAICDLNN
jgi:hypothetical protein